MSHFLTFFRILYGALREIPPPDLMGFPKPVETLATTGWRFAQLARGAIWAIFRATRAVPLKPPLPCEKVAVASGGCGAPREELL